MQDKNCPQCKSTNITEEGDSYRCGFCRYEWNNKKRKELPEETRRLETGPNIAPLSKFLPKQPQDTPPTADVTKKTFIRDVKEQIRTFAPLAGEPETPLTMTGYQLMKEERKPLIRVPNIGGKDGEKKYVCPTCKEFYYVTVSIAGKVVGTAVFNYYCPRCYPMPVPQGELWMMQNGKLVGKITGIEAGDGEEEGKL